MNKKNILAKILLLLSISILTVGCMAGDNLSKEREESAKQEKKDILINLPGPATLISEGTGFMNGIKMAQEEINQQGLLGGRKICVEIKDDKASFIEGMTVAQNIARDLDVIAVIGHWHSHVTLPAAAIYENAGVLLLSPIVSNHELTNKGYKYVFQNIPGDEEIGRNMVEYGIEKGYERLAIYYEDNPYGRGLADALERVAEEKGLNIIDRVSSFSNKKEKEKTLAKWQALDCQAVLVAVPVFETVDSIMKVKGYALDMPVIGSDSMDLPNLSEKLGEYAKEVAMVSLYNPSYERVELQRFIKEYKNKYQQDPDVWAVQGYDSLKLLAYAIEEAKSSQPYKIAEVLRNLKDWKGTVDDYGFDQHGRQTGRQIFFKAFVDGKFQYVIKEQ